MPVTALVTLVLLLNLVPSLAAGGTFARCFGDEDCVEGLKCREASNSLANNVPCTGKESYCGCAPTDLLSVFCTVPGSCNRFETCVPIPSSLLEQVTRLALTSVDLKVCIDNSQMPFILSPITCAGDSQCPRGDMECVKIQQVSFCASSSVPTRGSSKSQNTSSEVSPEPSPESTDPSSETESNSSVSVATIPQVTPTANQSSDSGTVAEDNLGTNVCIASKFLRHMTPELLLYESSYKAHVLCDINESCATPGHIVVYKGQSMMMSSYCSQVECQRRVMHVNSPRYKRKLRIASGTKDLEFAAFSARYGTKAEETLLTVAVRVGL